MLGGMAEGPSLQTVRELFQGLYEIEAELPWNGLSLVYRASRQGRPVAVAVLPIDCEGAPERAERFERYAEQALSLSHRRIVQVTGHGIRHGVPYVEMEYVEGRLLAEELAQGPMSRERASAIARQVLEALGAAHASRVLHADLTPSNVLLERGRGGLDSVRLIAVGLASVIRRARDDDRTGPTGKGSGPQAVRYLAPELLAGDPGTPRADLYAVGALLHHMLVGEPPSSSSPPVPEDARELVDRALGREPETRFPDAVTMTAALDDWLRSLMDTGRISLEPEPSPAGAEPLPAAGSWVEPGAATTGPQAASEVVLPEMDAERELPSVPPTPPASAAAEPRRRRSAVVPIAMVVALLAALGGAALWYLSREGTDRATAPPTQTAAPVAPVEEPEPEPEPAVPPSPLEDEDLPGPLVEMLARIEAGQEPDRQDLRPIYELARESENDPRPNLVLGHAFMAMGWSSNAVDRYEQAFEADESARHDPRMLENLVTLSTRPQSGDKAQAALQAIYGADALPAVDRALESSRLREERERLQRVRSQLAEP